jgi:hypothetical protein
MQDNNINTANDLRRTDNVQDQILCKPELKQRAGSQPASGGRSAEPGRDRPPSLDKSGRLLHFPDPATLPCSDFRTDSEYVYKTSPLGLGSPAGTHLARKPFRLVIARTLLCAESAIVTKVYLEKLECGHEITSFSDFYWDETSHLINCEPKAKRRGCEECRLALELPERKAA